MVKRGRIMIFEIREYPADRIEQRRDQARKQMAPADRSELTRECNAPQKLKVEVRAQDSRKGMRWLDLTEASEKGKKRLLDAYLVFDRERARQ